MADFLLLENGDKILLEVDDGSALLLEDVAAVTGFTSKNYGMWHQVFTNGFVFVMIYLGR